ncbi:MAG: sensor histidine kinase [Actinomycetota bacterium]|nr:sensor histidine kinase [Actinomycetota bacterium]
MSESPSGTRAMTLRQFTWATAFALAVTASTFVGLGFLLLMRGEPIPVVRIVPWVILIAAVELLPVTTWSGVQVSVGYPLIMAVALVFPPEIAALVGLLSASDPRELRREVSIIRALFNRCQVTLAVLAASAVFHSFASTDKRLIVILPAALAAILVDYVINLGLVTVAVSVVHRVQPLPVMKELLGRGQEFLVSYVGLGTAGIVLAKLYSTRGVGFLSVVTVIAPLLFARQMFLRSQALEEAHKELMEREQVLRALSNAMAEERADERIQIAGYLHDDLAQLIFRLSIQLDVARKMLDKGDLDQLGPQLDKIRESKQETSDRIRALSRDLHRSPLGAKGLAEALESFTDEVGLNSYVRFHREVADIQVPAPIALLVYHIAREGVMNALKHAQATDVWITVREVDGQIELQLRDNGVGFDTGLPGPEGHFGMVMMRERAQIGGGTFDVESAIDEGATITVRFPIALLQLEPTAAEPTHDGGDEDGGTPEADGPHPAHGRPEPHASGRSPASRASSRRH